jgi:hypothetical protein
VGVLSLLFLTQSLSSTNISVFVLFSYIVGIFLSVAGIVGGLYLVIHVVTWKRLSTESIEQAQGEIVWNGQNYIARVHNRCLKPCGRMNLLPGTWRFFYLPHSGWLLSAEKVATGKQQTLFDLQNALIQANDFDPEAVAANRQGQLSDNQSLRLVRLRLLCFARGALILVVSIAFGTWSKIALVLLIGGGAGLYDLWNGFQIAGDISE